MLMFIITLFITSQFNFVPFIIISYCNISTLIHRYIPIIHQYISNNSSIFIPVSIFLHLWPSCWFCDDNLVHS